MELRNNRDQSADAVTRDGRQHRRERHREPSADSAQSETPGMHGNSTRENRETPSAAVAEDAAGRLEKAMSRKSNMHAAGGSRTVVYYRRSVRTKVYRWRRAWREGNRPRRTSGRRPRPGLRAGSASVAPCSVCVRQHVKTSGRGSPRCSTTSPSICCGTASTP
jgi:hypothetical protein